MYCNWSFEKDYVHIYNLYVPPKLRGQGHAKKSLQQAINEIRKTGYLGKISIVANPKNNFINIRRLTLFYKNMGLEVYDYYG